MTGPEVTAAMKAEDVDAALVEKAARVLLEHDAERMECMDHDGLCCPTCDAHDFASAYKHQADALAEAGLLRSDADLMPLARNIVSQLGDLYMNFTHPATESRIAFVKYRQATNDAADEFVLRLIRTVRTEEAQIAAQEPAGGTQGGSGDSRVSEDADGAPVDAHALNPTDAGRLRVIAMLTTELDGARVKTAQWKARYEETRDELRFTTDRANLSEASYQQLMRERERVQALAQWFRDQGQVGYARKVEEAVAGVDSEHTPEPQHDHKWVFVTTYDARGLAVQQCTIAGCGVKRDMATGGVVLGLPTTNPFRPEDRA